MTAAGDTPDGPKVAPRANQRPLTGHWGDTPWIGEDQPLGEHPDLDAITDAASLGIITQADQVRHLQDLVNRQTAALAEIRNMHSRGNRDGNCEECRCPSLCPTLRLIIDRA